MRLAVLRQLGQTISAAKPTSLAQLSLSNPYSKFSSPHSGKMAVSYAAAVSTPDGGFRQPQIQARACSDPDMRASFEADAQKEQQKKPQRPGAGIRAKTSFRGWGAKKEGKSDRNVSGSQPYVVEESRPSGHFPRTEHKPNTGNEEEHVYVLTLKVTDSLAKAMDSMRDRYFPRHLNRTGAHLTLFHALPHSQLEALETGLSQISANMQPFEVSTGKPFRMRKGVGINVDEGYKNMKTVHQDLQSQWSVFLSEQDAGGFRPHWTVMNKVDDEKKVDDAFSTIRQELSERNQEGRAIGLDLWRYERGNWIFAKEWLFGEGEKSPTRVSKTPTKNHASPSPGSRGGHLSPPPAGEMSPEGGPGKRPGMFKRGSSVGDALRSMSFRRRS
jgi:mannose-1-phosphate guanylyltransferase